MNRDIRSRLSGIIVPVIAVAMLATVAKELPGGLRVDPAPMHAPAGQAQMLPDPCAELAPLPRPLHRASMSSTPPAEKGLACPIDRDGQSL